MMASACQLARLRLAQYVDNLTPASIADKGGSLIKGGMIGGISAPAKGIVGNTVMGGYKVLFQQPLEAGFDYIQSLGRSIATGGKIKPREFREVVSALDLQGMGAYAKGFKAGGKTVTDGMKAGRAAQRALPPGSGFGKWIAAYMDEVTLRLNADASRLGINTPTSVRIENPALRAMTEGAFAMVEAVDRPVFEGAFQMSHYMQAKLSAVRQGLKGAARQAEIDRLMANPTDEMMTRSLLDAQYATFKDKGRIANGLENFRRSLIQAASDQKGTPGSRAGGAAASLAMDVIMPFTGVPTSIASKGLSMSPLGLLSPKMLDGQAGRSRALANVTLGTGLMAAGYALAKDGVLVGDPPRATNAREDNDATRASYSLKVGDTWVDLRTMSPVSIPLLMGAALARKSEEDPEAGALDMAAAGGIAAGRAVTENSFAQGLKRSIEALGDENKAASFVAGAAGAAIPAAVSQVSRIMDPVDREANTIPEKLLNRTPGRVLLPERQTPFGTRPEKTLGERLSPASPIQVKQDRDTPEMAEVRRLGLAIGAPSRTMTRGGEKVELSSDQRSTIAERQGEFVLPAVRRLMDSPTYRTLPAEEQKRRMRIAIDRAKDRARAPVARDVSRLLRN
jgi:hypothetical protein